MAGFISRFFPKPITVANRDYIIYFAIALICCLSLFTTTVMFVLALITKNTSLALINIFGFIAAAYVWNLGKKGRLFFSIVVLCIGLYFYCVNGVLLLGWKSGFQYYLIALATLLLLYPYFKTRIITLFSFLPFITYVTLYFLLHDKENPYPQLSSFLHTFNILNIFFVLGFINFYFRTNILSLVNKLEHNNRTDFLTGLISRRFMTKELTRYCNVSERYESQNSLLLLGFDNFKAINDLYGHDAGDKILKQCADLLSQHINKTDLIARWGGDEFLILAPATILNDATLLANNLNNIISKNEFMYDKQIVKLTASIGVIEFLPLRSVEDTLKQIHHLLYSAKTQGKNTVVSEKLPNLDSS